MACVLARPATFQNPFSGQHVTGEQVQDLTWNKFDWISATPPPAHSVDSVTGAGATGDTRCTEPLGTNEIKGKENVNDTPVLKPTPTPNTDVESFNDARKGVKRKASEIDCDFEEILRPPKRISPFFNTPKERKDEKKKILKLSVQKIKLIENAELCLRKSVLINNTMQRLRHELKKDSNLRKRKRRLGQGMLNNDCLSESYLVDDPFLSGIHEKITDDMTDVLMSNLGQNLGVDVTSYSNASDSKSDNVNDFSAEKFRKTSENEAVDHNGTPSVVDQAASVTDLEETSAIVNELTTPNDVNFTDKNEIDIVASENCDTPVDAIKINLPLEDNEVIFEALVNNNLISESSPKFSERTR